MQIFHRSILTVAVLLSSTALAEWPQFRGDSARTAYTEEALAANLTLRWVYTLPQPPAPAWAGEDTRMPFDHARHVVLGGGLAFFGDSVTDKVFAVDAATGEERWTFHTGGPIRFAPAFWKDRVFVISDDGYCYALATETGKVLWKKRGGPEDSLLLGNERMIARWPARGAATVANDVLYFCAGIWPSEGISIHALDPNTGETLWLNDSAGYLELDQPHPRARAKSGVSAQGYLAISGNDFMLPTGRALPAAFNLNDGTFRYFHLQKYGIGWFAGHGAGPIIAMVDGVMFNKVDLFNAEDGLVLTTGIEATKMAAFPEQIAHVRDKTIEVLPRASLLLKKEGVDRKGKAITTTYLNKATWSHTMPEPLSGAVIGAGDKIIACTQSGRVFSMDINTRKLTIIGRMDGVALGFAAAGGRLYASTDQGSIYCFADAAETGVTTRYPKPSRLNTDVDPIYAKIAEKIIAKTGISKGYCLDFDCGEGELSLALALQTDLKIIAITPDPEAALRARARMEAAGLHGNRVTVLPSDLAQTHLPNAFANLIVSGKSVTEGAKVIPREEIARLQRPYGGTVCLGKPNHLTTDVRGAVEGAGEWTHQYCSASNEACSTDTVVKGTLRMLWWTDNTHEMPSRHGRGPSPLFWNGLLFKEGLHGIQALDAYNGHVVWECWLENILAAYDQEHLNGAAVTGGNYCINDGFLYVRMENRCLKLNAMTGEKVAEFTAPLRADGTMGTWGYIACEDGLLFGSLVIESHIIKYAFQGAAASDMSQIFSESDLLFALDVETGAVQWILQPKQAIRQNTIALGEGRIYCVDRALARIDRFDADALKRRGKLVEEHPPGTMLALDAKKGTVLWEAGDIFGTVVILSTEHDALLTTYQNTSFKLKSEIGDRMAVYRASTGEKVWDVEAKNSRARPILNGQTIYAQPGAWDLLTGEKLPFTFDRSYGCGTVSGSTHMLAYRSATLGYTDLTADKGTENYGGIRPGCWINTIPAGGLLLLPETANRCTCSYLIKANIALEPHPE